MSMLSQSKAVIFDLDNTLYDENNYIRAVCEGFCLQNGLGMQHIETITKDEFRVRSKDIFGDWLQSFESYTPAYKDELFFLYENLPLDSIPPLALESIALYDDARELLSWIQGLPFKLGILTNGSLKAQNRKVEILSLKNFGFHIEYARVRGVEYEKPHSDAFMRILSRLQVNADEAIFIGDNPKTDIAGAYNAGLQAIWLKRGYGALLPCEVPHIAITHLSEIKDL